MPDIRKPSRFVVPVDEPSLVAPIVAWLSRFGDARLEASVAQETVPPQVTRELEQMPATLAWLADILTRRKQETVRLATELARVARGSPDIVADIARAESVHRQNIANMRLWFDDAGPILDMVGGSTSGGGSGGTGTGGSALPVFYDNEVPAGAVNGSNKTFVLPASPVSADALHFEVNGQTWYYGGANAKLASVTGPVVVTTTAPPTNALLRAWFRA